MPGKLPMAKPNADIKADSATTTSMPRRTRKIPHTIPTSSTATIIAAGANNSPPNAANGIYAIQDADDPHHALTAIPVQPVKAATATVATTTHALCGVRLDFTILRCFAPLRPERRSAAAIHPRAGRIRRRVPPRESYLFSENACQTATIRASSILSRCSIASG
jgi:hypothetical protein